MAALNLRRFSDPDFLRTIAPRRLAAFLNPWRGYLAGRGLVLPPDQGGVDLDHTRLAHILMQPDGHAPAAMIDALFYVHETASVDDSDALLDLAFEREIKIDDEVATTVADVAVQIWLASPDLLRERHATTVAFRQKNFLYYGGSRRGGMAFPTIEGDKRKRLQADLDDWFGAHRRGRGCGVFFFPRKKKVWILVRHGMPMKREASHGDDGTSATEVYRPQLHDVLVYDGATDEIAVHAGTRGEVKLYLACFGRLLFGDPGHFPASDKFTLQPLWSDGAASLQCEDVEEVEAVRLVEYRKYWGGEFRELEIRKAEDIFAALAARGQVFPPGGRLTSAVFKVKFAGAPKERAVTIRPPHNAKCERDEDGELVENWLSRRGFIVSPEPSTDDDEAPTPVLESA